MTLQQLKYITLVAEKGNITDAAKALYISQPSLTAAIKELEKDGTLAKLSKKYFGEDVFSYVDKEK